MFCVAFYKTSHKCGKISILNLSAYQLIGLLPGPHEICFHLINKLTENKYLTWRLGWQRKWILNKKRKTNKQKKDSKSCCYFAFNLLYDSLSL